jgi:flagellar hook-associated protein 3 FlgL
MRITSGIMMNNSLFSINNNKVLMDSINTQLNTQKKIQRPSEDPIVAIRALRLRTTYAEVCQYLEKNVPDARSWINCTNDALDSINEVLTEVTYYCNQGVNDYNTPAERKTLKETLEQLKYQIYADGDADLSGRTLFTGYKTDSTLTFKHDDPDKRYSIKQTFSATDVDDMKRIAGLNTDTIHTADQRNITNNSFHVIKVAYDDIDTIGTITLTNATGATSTITPQIRSKEVYEAAGNSVYTTVSSGAVFVPETGELLLSDTLFETMTNGGTIDVTYEKEGFKRGDLRPEHYFDCTDMTDGIDYVSADQQINYTINFNQTIKINTQAKDVLKHDMGRDLDEIIYSVQAALDAQTKIDKINIQKNATTDAAVIAQLDSMLIAAELELAYAEENMGKAFSASITKYQEHQQVLNDELADLGARLVRLDLNEQRLSTQKLNVENQKSANEEIDVAATAVKLNSASNVYDASLMAAAKIVQNSLLDFL